MNEMLLRVGQSDPFREVCSRISVDQPLYVGGLYGSSLSLFGAALAESRDRPTLIIAPTNDAAEAIYTDLAFFTDREVLFFSPWQSDPSKDETPDPDIFAERFEVARGLALAAPRAVVTSVQAIEQPLPDPSLIRHGLLHLAVGQEHPMEQILAWLVDRGFARGPVVEMPGEFSVRGGIIDLFAYSEDRPWRIELAGDRIDSIRTFDPATQGSVDGHDAIAVAAVDRREFFRASGGANEQLLLDYLPEGQSLLLLHELAPDPESEDAPDGAWREKLHSFPLIYSASLPFVEEREPVQFRVKSIQRFVADFAGIPDSLRALAQTEPEVVIACHNKAEAHRLTFFADKAELIDGREFHSRIGTIRTGFEMEDAATLVIGYREMFNRYRQTHRARRYTYTRPLQDLSDLKPGDLVVHTEHGVGRYTGLEEIRKADHAQEYLAIEYRGGARLFVPVLNVETVQKYVGVGGRPPDLSRIGGKEWKRRKVLAEGATALLAREFIEMQALRESRIGIACPVDDELQHEFESAFIYQDTPDQETVSQQIADDMQVPKPMDRLLCGDVGYGKTELAMRAAFRTVNAGRQVAMLVPTTLLAQQHFETLSERMADYPINVEAISRFRTRKQQREILERAEVGTLDILIGTHRLIQPDVRFRNLGLVIIDEEQRFGVEHKERLKRLRATVDLLTLTATPIPRTLHQTLIGIRDISRLETPPTDRLAIATEVCRWDRGLIRKAIRRELKRNGQVFFVHNRVQNIQSIATQITEIVPEATVGIVHGQMPEHLIEERMTQFTHKEFDVLVATTIIESGLDIPNVNTLFVNNADRFGLADLHQLRGRVGRYKHRAYAYFLLPSRGAIASVSEERLRAIEELNQLGAGYQIALRDLEIRGAGNLLGKRQSGHIQAIGYHLYCRLLKQATEQLKSGAQPSPLDELTLNLPVAAYLPDAYLPDIHQKLEIYRALSSVATPEAVADVAAQLADRFGPLPEPVERLLAEAIVRLMARAAGLVQLTMQDDRLFLRYRRAARATEALTGRVTGLRVLEDGTISILVPPEAQTPSGLLAYLKNLLQPPPPTATISGQGG